MLIHRHNKNNEEKKKHNDDTNLQILHTNVLCGGSLTYQKRDIREREDHIQIKRIVFIHSVKAVSLASANVEY